MAKYEKDYTENIAKIADAVEVIVKECLAAYDSTLQKTVMEAGDVQTILWTGMCVYFGGREAALSVVLTGGAEACHLVVHAAPGVGAASIDSKVIRKITEKLTRIERQ